MANSEDNSTTRFQRLDNFMSAWLPSRLHRIVRFGIVGIGTTLLYFILTTVFVFGAGLQPASASVCAYLAALILSYLLQSRFTFRVVEDNAAQLTRFIATTIVGLAASSGIMELVTGTLDLHYVFGAIAVCILIPIINFVIFSRWVFVRRTVGKPSR